MVSVATGWRSPSAGWAWLAAAVALYTAVALGLGAPGVEEFFSTWVYTGMLLAAAAICAGRALIAAGERVPWLALAASAGLWAAGELVWELVMTDQVEPPYPSIADALWLASYPATLLGIGLLVRARLRGSFRPVVWLDAAIAASAVAAAVAAAALGPVVDLAEGGVWPVATDLAYPLGDLALVVMVLVVLALTGWRPSPAWAVLALALAAQATTDILFARQVALGTYDGGLLEPLWPAAFLLLAWAAWRPLPAPAPAQFEGARVFLLPAVFTALGLGVLCADQLSAVNDVATVLAIAAIALGVARMGVSFRENVRLLRCARRDARTDALTGLANRRALVDDLDRELARGPAARRQVLALFDLDGFKLYNDEFGHPAGDALLARLGRRLADAVDGGRAYRLGGDEFCLLLGEADSAPLLDAAAAALAEQGEGFAITSSHGIVVLPREAADSAGALQLADRRMYAAKDARPASTVRQSSAVLLKVLAEREPDLHEHVASVTELARGVARRLHLSPEDRDVVARAAELHDIGKMAIPDTILDKPGPLDEDEWAFMHRHTIIGEEILNAAPALQPVARLVRASHERWDGTGYPDGTAGEEIPLGARIVAVCDAFSAMTQERPYQSALRTADALAEIERCAGRDFEPRVVKVFVDEIGSRMALTG